jgi:hypothetical protein
MVLVCDRDGELIYATSVRPISQALEEVGDIFNVRVGVTMKVTRLHPRPWSTIPFTLNSLTLMAGANA